MIAVGRMADDIKSKAALREVWLRMFPVRAKCWTQTTEALELSPSYSLQQCDFNGTTSRPDGQGYR